MCIARQVGAKVRRLRQSKNWSQEALALACGLNRAYIGSMERGEHSTGVKNLQVVASALGVLPHELLMLENSALVASPVVTPAQMNTVVIDWPVFATILRTCAHSPAAIRNFLERSGVELL